MTANTRTEPASIKISCSDKSHACMVSRCYILLMVLLTFNRLRNGCDGAGLGLDWNRIGEPTALQSASESNSDNTARHNVGFGYFMKNLLLEIFQVSDMGTPRVK